MSIYTLIFFIFVIILAILAYSYAISKPVPYKFRKIESTYIDESSPSS